MIEGLCKFLRGDAKNTKQASTNATARAGELQSDEDISMAATGGRRAREEENSSGGEARGGHGKVKQSGSAEEDNLTPNYNPHPEAQPISFPGAARGGSGAYSFERDWRGKAGAKEAPPPQKRMAPVGRRGGGGIRPTNTLGNSAPQAAKGRNMFSNYIQDHPRAAPNGRAQPAPARNGIAPSSSTLELGEDPVEDDDVPSPQASSRKRRKVEGGKSSNPVDLTGDEEGTSLATGSEIGDGRGSGGSQAPVSKKPKNVTPWASTEQRAVHSLVHIKPGSVKVAPPDADFTMPDVPSSQPVATKENIINVDDDDSLTINGNAAVGTSPRAKNDTTAQRQTIDLMAGWDEINAQVNQREAARKPPRQLLKQNPQAYSQADRDGANTILSAAATGKKSKPAKSSRPSTSAQGSREQSHEFRDGNIGSYVRPSPSRSVASESTSLQKKFVRDDTDAQAPRRQKATQRMQISSQNDQPTNDNDIDELEGPPTVGTSASHQISPVPAALQGNRHSSASRQISPGNIRPTRLTESCPPTSDVGSLQDDTDSEVRIPLKSIFCKAICSNVRGLELVWDDSLSAFYIFSQQQRQRSPSSNKPITISQSEITQWCHSKDHNGAYLKGPASEVSNGGILMDFYSESELSDCFNMLHSDRHSLKALPLDQMDKVFQKQKAEQLDAHNREKSRGLTNPVVPNRKLVRNARMQPRQQEEEERIVYEADPSLRPVRARDRMRNDEGETLAQAIVNDGHRNARRTHHNDTTSPFFNNDGIRRSTRQAKPVDYEERPRSPVKWTKVHNPEPWAHPVLYPPEGAKRVTVEFNDLERLDEEEWLNDNLVNYELKHIENGMAPEHREKVHFFNTFFFTSVSTNGSKRAFNYDAVKRWTKNIDIFTIPYLVVPISENLHWFVIVICNLHNLPRRFLDDEAEEKMDTIASDNAADPEIAATHKATLPPRKDDHEIQKAQDTAVDNVGSSPASEAHGEKSSDEVTGEDEANVVRAGDTFVFGNDGKVVEEELAQSRGPNIATSKKSKKKAPAPRTYDPDQPILIALDSFGHPRSAEMKILKQWIAAEAAARRKMEVDWKDLQGMNAKDLPAQLNFSDCGVFLAGYVHAFAQDPQKFITKAVRKELGQEDLFADFDPIKKRNDMRERLLQLHKDQEKERVARKKAKAAAKYGLTPQAPKVAHVTNIDTAKAQSPAPKSSPAPAQSSAPKPNPASPLKSEINTASTIAASAAAQLQQEMSSATAAGEDELAYEPPHALGEKADRDEPSDPLPSSDREPVNDDGDTEMLDNEDEPETEEKHHGKFRFPDGYRWQPSSTNVFTQDLPVAPADTSVANDNLLNDLLNMRESDSKQKAEANIIINLEDDDEQPSQQLEPVIPDSQEKENHPDVEEKEDKEDRLVF